ncbi:hypothetical protein FQR65_LT05597 [Abscondita terminalis]|nr:hypothetical protein FQR65_LT05597 [Abscondita terminalis]
MVSSPFNVTSDHVRGNVSRYIAFVLFGTTMLWCHHVIGEGNVNFKRVFNQRRPLFHSEQSNSSNESVDIKRSIPVETDVSPRFSQIPEKFFQTNFRHDFSTIKMTPNFSELTPNFGIQTTLHHRNFPAKAPVSFKGSATSVEQILEYEWSTFKRTFNKTYFNHEEEVYRREIFIENRNKVARFNQEYGTGLHSFVQKLNNFADLLNHEFNNKLNGFNNTIKNKPTPERKSSAFIKSANVGLPYSVDWREIGAVTAVKSQGTCGACYAFATVGALEGQQYRRTGRLIDLSVQNLIDCTMSYANDGCVGGVIEYAYEYIKDNKGIDTEHFYPFEQRDGAQCRYKPEGYGAQVTGYVLLDEHDEEALEWAVATVGPVAVAIDASPDSFQFYSNGVYFDSGCKSSSEELNHAVLVVGYGTEPDGQKYWLIKNSYGSDWGIGGYMKIAKFSNNLCGIATYASYPLL